MPYDFVPISVGDHIRKKRLELGLLQREAAKRLGVNPWTILNWEKGHTEPPVFVLPAILAFLGYDPFPEPKNAAQHLKAKRREMGWTIKEAAQAVGVDPCAWSDWERGRIVLYLKHRAAISDLLGLPIQSLNNEMTPHWGRVHKRGSLLG